MTFGRTAVAGHEPCPAEVRVAQLEAAIDEANAVARAAALATANRANQTLLDTCLDISNTLTRARALR